MLTLILTNVQYLKNVGFSFEKRFKWSKPLLLRFLLPNKNISPRKISDSLHPVTLFGEPCLLKEGLEKTLCISTNTICQSFQLLSIGIFLTVFAAILNKSIYQSFS